MDERELLVLGLLMTQSQHGYKINEFIENNLGRVSDMKKATAYSILKRLNQNGYVDVTIEQEGNRPPRQIYTITPNGNEQFKLLLRMTLSSLDNVTPSGDIGFMFIDHLSTAEAVELIELKLQKVDLLIKSLASVPQHGHRTGIDLSIQHRITLLECEKAWLSKLIFEMNSSI
ncbi:Transcriptional regulator PadR-like family protein [Paenibacillus sp. 1_12]|uniref:PadR family transcriptional regulator n=1 Tax=Paenibacillus sp. 1_12 TaxID=1566278 RepID=UPI0008DF8335|nr:PadR family transcriptional regulator [Paenibacillus sp. 1_12]SFL35793.1 Transcriptional regulator PadR-like family protein [Paenibacillus sp. 1_12]